MPSGDQLPERWFAFSRCNLRFPTDDVDILNFRGVGLKVVHVMSCLRCFSELIRRDDHVPNYPGNRSGVEYHKGSLVHKRKQLQLPVLYTTYGFGKIGEVPEERVRSSLVR